MHRTVFGSFSSIIGLKPTTASLIVFQITVIFRSLTRDNPIFSFDKSLCLSIIYILRKIKENLYCGSLIFFNFSALASSNYAIIVAARCSQKSILEDEFN